MMGKNRRQRVSGRRRRLGSILLIAAALLLPAAACSAVPQDAFAESAVVSAPAGAGADPLILGQTHVAAGPTLRFVPVPEPTTVSLLVGGGILILVRRRRRNP